MKIVHIHQYYNDNMGYHENILPDYQAKLGHEVVMITSTLSNGFNGDSRNKKEGIYQDKNFIVKRIGIKGEFKNRFVIFKDLYKSLEEEKPDYIYHHSVTAPSLKIACLYKKNHPNIFLATDNHADWNISAQNKLWKLAYYNIFWTQFIKKYDKYIDIYFGVTPLRCLFLNEELGVPMDKIRLLPIGADIDNINIEISREAFLKKYDIDENALIITHGGKITPEKQVDRILEAFMRIKNKEIRLILFGKVEDEKVEKLIKQDKRIKYVGWMNRVDTLAMLKYSDLGIWNTQHTTLLEDAIAVGLPIILRYYGSTSHLVKNNGEFLYGGSVREIQDKIQAIVNDKRRLENMREASYINKQILGYGNIAKESIEYMKNIEFNGLYRELMSKEYTDFEYENIKQIR